MSWPTTSLGEVVDFRNGLNYSRSNFGTGLKVISVGDFGDRLHPDLDSLGEINPDGVAKAGDCLVDGDMLFVRSNGNRDLVGRVMLMQGIGDQLVGYSGFCIRGRLRDSFNNNPAFFVYQIRDAAVRQRLTAGGVGASIANVSQKTLSNLVVYKPRREIQDVIVSAISVYDDLIATNRRRISLLEEAARRVYREWFVHLRFPGHEDVKVESGVPEGWSKKTLNELADISMGQSPESRFYNKDGEGLPFHQGVTGFGERFVNHEQWTTQATRYAQAGDILCSVRAPVGRLNITRDRIAIGRGLSSMRSRLGFQSLLLHQLKNLFVAEDIIGGGAIFASVGKKELFGQVLLQPSAEIAEQFNVLVSTMDSQIDTLEMQNRSLAAGRDALLPKLMSGRLDVSGIPLPERDAA